jgi:hypothetical protein
MERFYGTKKSSTAPGEHETDAWIPSSGSYNS